MGALIDSTDAALELLTGPVVDDLLEAALSPVGGRVIRWSLRDIDHRPGRRTTATYTAETSWPDGVRTETFGASIDPRRRPGQDPPGDRLIVTDGDHAVEIWRFPYDPELPALAAATIPAAVEQTLTELGLPAQGPTVRVVSYRPRKRAVVEVTAPAGRWFLKVLRPAALTGVRSRHDLLTDADVPVPPVLAHRDDGLLVLGELTGTPLRDLVAARGEAALEPRQVLAVLDRLPDAVRRLPRREPWSAHATHYAGVVGSASPDLAGWAQRLAADIAAEVSGSEGDDQPTHGDFYESQLMISGGRITGLLDVDTVGPGARADDLACLLGHLSVLAVMDPASAAPMLRAVTGWQPAFERQVGPGALRVRAAGVVLSLATGPFRAREEHWEAATADRLALAERWLESSTAPHRPTSLRNLSSHSPQAVIPPRKS